MIVYLCPCGFATEAAQFVVDAVQIHGARALRQGHLLEHLYR
jgi:hypothetical protein